MIVRKVVFTLRLKPPCELSQVRARAGTRATETAGTRDMVTKAMAMVAAMATMTTLLVTMDMVPDMITVRTPTNLYSFWVHPGYMDFHIVTRIKLTNMLYVISVHKQT